MSKELADIIEAEDYRMALRVRIRTAYMAAYEALPNALQCGLDFSTFSRQGTMSRIRFHEAINDTLQHTKRPRLHSLD